jgi:hypothetical protein
LDKNELFTKLKYIQVSSTSIPNVSKIPNRKKLVDYPLDESIAVLFDHTKWDNALKRHVKVGQGNIGDVNRINVVDYDGIKVDQDYLDYLIQLDEANPSLLQPAEQLAFWMNAYNALCINIILQYEAKNHCQISSITELSQKNGPVWDQIAGRIGGNDISLNDIEHERLRKIWDEPLIHACIVCASASCPDLRAEAFVVSSLKEQMEDQMRLWLKNDSKGIRFSGNTLQLSRIFLWFSADFGEMAGIKSFLSTYCSEDDNKSLRERLERGKLEVRYFDYNWKINRA